MRYFDLHAVNVRNVKAFIIRFSYARAAETNNLLSKIATVITVINVLLEMDIAVPFKCATSQLISLHSVRGHSRQVAPSCKVFPHSDFVLNLFVLRGV